VKRARREAEAIVLAMVAAVPLYFTATIDIPSVALFHVVMALILVAEVRRPGFTISLPLLRVAAVAYFFFYFVDAAILSRSLIRGTSHLLFFIAAYQALDRTESRRAGHRLLVTFFIAVASIATSTHLTIVFFLVVFAALAYRELVSLSHEETLRLVGKENDERPPSRVAAAYVLPMVLLAALLFPFLPRLRDPFVRGFAQSLQTSTGFTDMIDMSDARSITTDPRVVARVSMSRQALQLFSPIRLRGGHYDRYVDDKWVATQTTGSRQYIRNREDGFVFAEPRSATATINIQQSRSARRNQKLYLPVGTFAIDGIPRLRESRIGGSYYIPGPGLPVVSYDVQVSTAIDPFRPEGEVPEYEVPDAIRQLADQIAANATTTRENAVVIERYLATRYEYLINAETRAPINAEKFLLEEKRGHCEHFAAGMVLLLAARDVPARIAGGYYGGELNPLTGYFVIRQRDAHAWVEVWENDTWVTYDPTPADLRPGSDVPNFFVTYLKALSDSVNFFWDRYILTFGTADQINIAFSAFLRVRDALDALRRGAATAPPFGRILLWAGILALVVATLMLLVIRPRFRRTLFERLVARLRRAGVTVRPEMTTDEILTAVESTRPGLLSHVRTVVDCYRLERFAPSGPGPELSGAARNALRMIKA
jgi:transglutaminase-like putative cysteine protease